MPLKKCPQHNFLLNSKGQCVWCERAKEYAVVDPTPAFKLSENDQRLLRALRIKVDD